MKRYYLIATAGVMAAFCSLTASAQADSTPTEWASGTIAADDMPQRWTMDRQFDQSMPTADEWWHAFGDTLLDSLIAQGEANNYNLSAAFHRIEMARQTLLQARAAYFPSLNLSGGWTKSRTSGAMTDPARPATTVDYFTLGLNASWEIDVFGRVREQAKSAKAAIGASRADYAATMVSVAANIASAYFQLRMYQAELDVARTHIASQEHIVAMTEARHDAGLASMLDVRQARTVLLSTQATVPQLEAMIESAANSITILIGQWPEALREALMRPRPMPGYYQIVATGLPMDLLRRRPDVVQAEYELAQYAAALGMAKKDFLPTLSLNGSIGTSAHRPGDLFTNGSFTYTIAPQLSWTIFDGMSRRYRTAQAKEQMMAGIDNYNMTVLGAVQEVDNAMTAYTSSLQSIGLIDRVVEESRQALELSVDMYRQGLTPFSNVVDAQLNLLQYQNSLLTSQGKALTALVNLYQALGGGWQQPK